MAANSPQGRTPYGIDAGADALYRGVRKMSRRRQEEWLRRSKTWDGLDPRIWKAKKVIGMGGNGLVGLWEYQGFDPYMPKRMVIKQGRDDNGMGWESRLLKALATTGSDHFVKLYKANHHVGGSGTSSKFDPVPFHPDENWYDRRLEANRLYLEFCENGDLQAYNKKWRDARKVDMYPPEEFMWRIFGCLAKAILVLEKGSEDPDIPNPNWFYPNGIAHFDIKEPNILIGGRDAMEHNRFNICKLADFGLALPVPEARYVRGIHWKLASQWRATEGYMPPEQRYPAHPNRLISHQTNVWAVGATMHHLLSGRHVEHAKFDYILTHPVTSIETTLTVQGNILLQPSKHPQPDGKERYLPNSKLLIDTILYFLAFDPSERLSATDLVRTTQNALTIYNQMAAYGPPLANDPYSVLFQPNIAPQNQPLIGKNPPPQLNLELAGTRGYFEYTGGKLVGVSPANPNLLFPDHVPQVPRRVRKWEYPYSVIPDSPVGNMQP